jgi:hypothetical protein
LQRPGWPFGDQTYYWRSIAIPVPATSLRSGANTLELYHAGAPGLLVSSISLVLVGAGPAL